MARRFRQLNRAAVLWLLAILFTLVPPLQSACAAPTPSPSPSPAPAGVPNAPPPAVQPTPIAKPKAPKPAKSDEWTEARRLFEQLSADQQKKFLDNLDQWKTMPAEERELLRDRDLFRREKIAQEIQEAINKSGLHLNDDQREVYALRYTQERRKIEEALHKEMDQKRQSMVGEMLARLKVEFLATPTPVGGKATPAR